MPILPLFLLVFAALSQIGEVKFASFFLGSNRNVNIVEGTWSNATVCVEYQDVRANKGYTHFHANATGDAAVSDADRAYALGFAEGYATAARINELIVNTKATAFGEHFEGTWPARFRTYAEQQLRYISEQARANQSSDFWRATELVAVHQVAGLVGGYDRYKMDHPEEAVDFEHMDHVEFYMHSAIGDWEGGLETALYSDSEAVLASVHARMAAGLHSHCSGAVRITDNLADIFMAHDTWTSWGTGFNRVLKHIEYNFQGLGTRSQRISYSSSAGLLFSIDDFYMIRSQTGDKESKLGVLETTFNIFDDKLQIEAVTPQSVLTWTRTMVACLLARDGDSFVAAMTAHDSGTYNNNWLVVDYGNLEDLNARSFDSRESKLEYVRTANLTLLTSLEIVPKLWKAWDATGNLTALGFYASLNSPTDSEVSKWAGYTGDPYFDFYNGSRYKIMLRDMPNVHTLADMKRLMRSNNYQKDPYCDGDPGSAIASRYDLRSPDAPVHKAAPFGCTDSKICTLASFETMGFHVIMGPTLGDGNRLPHFQFAKWPGVPHMGVPDILPITTTWALFTPTIPVHQMNVAAVISLGIIFAVIVVGLVTYFALRAIKRRRARYARMDPSTAESRAAKPEAEAEPNTKPKAEAKAEARVRTKPKPKDKDSDATGSDEPSNEPLLDKADKRKK